MKVFQKNLLKLVFLALVLGVSFVSCKPTKADTAKDKQQTSVII